MKVDPETLGEFKKALDKEYGVAHTDQEAFDCFTRVVNALRILYSPAPREGEGPAAEPVPHKKF